VDRALFAFRLLENKVFGSVTHSLCRT
jgi:hypothetical protein